jgi:hypothetical protein
MIKVDRLAACVLQRVGGVVPYSTKSEILNIQGALDSIQGLIPPAYVASGWRCNVQY